MVDRALRYLARRPSRLLLPIGLAFLGAEFVLPALHQPHVWTVIGVVYVVFALVLGAANVAGIRSTPTLMAAVAACCAILIGAVHYHLTTLELGVADDPFLAYLFSPRLLVPYIAAFLGPVAIAPPDNKRFVLLILTALPFVVAFVIIHATIQFRLVGLAFLAFYALVGAIASLPLVAILSQSHSTRSPPDFAHSA